MSFLQAMKKGRCRVQYISTRNKKLQVSSASAIKQGLSEEGGLFVPEKIPALSLEDIKQLTGKSYIQRAQAILKMFLTDFTEEEIRECTEGAYGGGKFSSDKVAPVVKLNESAYILELWHGPTCAFKDMALQILPHFLTTSIKKTGEEKTIVILVATSGDTGKAALEGFRDVDGTKIMVFYPSDGVSDIQKLQMITQEGANVCVSGIHGNFDDAQTGVKKIFTNSSAKEELSNNNYILSSANSINWGRLVPQIVYYISAYCDMLETGDIKLGDKVNVCVPTGNFGNILAAYYARKMGLPIKTFICASNKNNVLTDFIQTGKYNKNREFHTTISPSMDILISSNLERLLFDLSDNDDNCVKACMNDLNESGEYVISETLKHKISELFWAGCCDDYFTKERIAKTKAADNYTLDTHTAVAVDVYEQYVKETGDKTKTIIASTASPFKFGDSVLDALNIDTKDKTEFELLDLLKDSSGMDIPESLRTLDKKDKRFTSVCDSGKMLQAVKDFLEI